MLTMRAVDSFACVNKCLGFCLFWILASHLRQSHKVFILTVHYDWAILRNQISNGFLQAVT